MTQATRAVWFPLRSNLGFFETTAEDHLDVSSRVKQMAVMADELIFEPGLLDLTVTSESSFDVWIPPDQLDEGDIHDRRAQTGLGKPAGLVLREESSPGVEDPTATPVPVAWGTVERTFVVEFHLLLEESGLDDVPWARFGMLSPPDAAALRDVVSQTERSLAPYRDAPTVSPNRWLDGRLKKGLARDLVHGAAAGLSVAVDDLHQPLLEWKAREGEEGATALPGTKALSLWVPDFTALSWKTIIGVHDHDAIGAFRAKLVEVEETAAALPVEERDAAIRDLGFYELREELRKRMASYVDVGAEAAANSLVDLIPYGGLIYSAATDLARARRDATSWVAVLLKLTEESRR